MPAVVAAPPLDVAALLLPDPMVALVSIHCVPLVAVDVAPAVPVVPVAPELLSRYGLRFVVAAPGDFQEHGVHAPHELAEQPYLRLRHVSGEGFRIYEIAGGPGGRDASSAPPRRSSVD